MTGTGCLRAPDRPAVLGDGRPGSEPELLFHSGFEADTAIEKLSETRDRIMGVDHSVSGNNDWSSIALNSGGRLHGGTVTYESGDSGCVRATIAPDPTTPDNRVICLKGVASPNARKFRIQADFSAPAQNGLTEFSCSVKLYVPASMAALRDYPKAIDWLTVAEFWNDPAWTSREDTEHAFRVTVGIGKNAGVGENLYFRISTDDFSHTGTGTARKYKQIHLAIDRATHFAIPFDTWMTLEYYFRDGGYPDTNGHGGGHFYMAATPECGVRQEICSLRSTMHSPANLAPRGVSLWAPIKMYTSNELAAWMQSQGRELTLFFDDLTIWTGQAVQLTESRRQP